MAPLPTTKLVLSHKVFPNKKDLITLRLLAMLPKLLLFEHFSLSLFIIAGKLLSWTSPMLSYMTSFPKKSTLNSLLALKTTNFCIMFACSPKHYITSSNRQGSGSSFYHIFFRTLDSFKAQLILRYTFFSMVTTLFIFLFMLTIS